MSHHPDLKGIDLFHISFSYRSAVPVITDLSLHVAPGEVVGIVGPNGSGKSTLVRIINGSLRPVGGSVVMNGLRLTEEGDLPSIRGQVISIYADPENQLVTPTVFDELAFALQAGGVPEAELRARVEEGLARSHLARYHDTHPFYLSVGEQFRLLIAAALVRRPRFIVLDEALSMLDGPGRDEIIACLLEARAQDGVGVLLVTHRLEDLWSADRIVVLVDGKIVGDAAPAQIFEQAGQHPAWGIEAPVPIFA
jgi:energy-coupling factor transporter ATP-binding protein EcfA2